MAGATETDSVHSAMRVAFSALIVNLLCAQLSEEVGNL